MSENAVIYPGFFDPFTLGHLNIVERATKVFAKVIVAVAGDSPKTAMFSPAERLEIVKEIFRGNRKVEVDQFSGLLVQYARRKKVHVLLRGIRTVSDFEYEYQMALGNKTLESDVETFFMMTEGKFSYLSSTVIKEISRLGGDISQMVPRQVVDRVKKKYET
ncbi:MAG TPA: pantetheine-phosphate adenylyltransferase [Bdellovibrionota bacterium]|nr:pantetheine-phosphate adenylyltransferase [Bdellovibrionota bacterium]